MLKIAFLFFLILNAKTIQWPDKLGSQLLLKYMKQKRGDGSVYVQLEVPQIEQTSDFWNHLFSEGY